MELAADVIIERPVSEVFAYFADLERAPEWAAPVVARRKTTPGPVGVGMKFHAVDHVPGRNVEYDVEVTAFERDRRMAATLGQPMAGSWEVQFAEAAGGTRMGIRADMTPPGPEFLTPLVGGWMRRAIRKDLATMKERLEAGQKPL